MLRDSLSWYIFTFTLLELIIKTHLTLHDSSHGFISKNPRYFDEDLSNIHEEISSLRTSRISDVPLKLQLRFEPSVLDFKNRPLGVPHLEKVTLFNVDKNKSIDMTSISGSTVHFHSSFFEDKRIPPNGNTSFNVVFLGREEGYVESSLFIHTSEGFLKYNVKGASTFSHYRLRPIVGIKVPLNSSFSPLIYMHNPHSEPIQIVEIYSSGGGFHLELPTGEQEGPNDMWEILPQQTKAVIRVKFQAKVIQNHTAYVRIKLNRPNEILVVPLEIEVVSGVEIIHPQGYVDFGVGGTLDAPREVKLCLYNPSKKYVRVHSITSTSKAINIQYVNARLQPETDSGDMLKKCADVGTLTIDWKTAYETKDFSGKIIVEYRNGKNRSEIPFYLTVLKGGVSYDPTTSTYFINEKTPDIKPRPFQLKNDFECPLYVEDVIFPEESDFYFKIETFTPKTIMSGNTQVLFNVRFKNSIRLSDLQLQSHILLKTNISDIKVPLLSYNGKLDVHLPFNSTDQTLDIGLISFNARKEVFFMLVNHNPVPLSLRDIHTSLPMTDVDIHGCGDGDYKLALFQVSFANLTKCRQIKANNYAIIKVVVSTTHVEGQLWGDIFVETQYENLKIPVHFKIAPGKFEIGPDRMVFDQCFPAKICSLPLRIHSTFNDRMVIEGIIPLPPDVRIHNKHAKNIPRKASKFVGYVFLSPDLECKAECYTGLQVNSSVHWMKTFVLTKFVTDFDLHLVNVFYNRYMNLTSNGLKKWQNLTLRLDTSGIKGYVFKSRVKMSWPSLILDTNSENRSFLSFPLTQVGNITYQNITIWNPASCVLILQLVLDKDYPNSGVLVNGLPPNLIPKKTPREYAPSSSFFFDNSTRRTQMDFFWDVFGVRVNRNTMPIFLKPGHNISVLIGFYSKDANIHRALLFLRNNLTILETVRLRAQGALPLFKFGNRKPGSVQHLAFDMTGTHLSDCDRINGKPPSLTVKRTFTARNTGDITVYVNSFYINDVQCEGYGFKVLDCQPFVLPPNATKKIDIAFTPDLTLTRVSRLLILSTSLNEPVNYTLQSSIPPDYLNLCAKLLSRPRWETYLSWICIFIMLLLLVSVMFFSTLEAEEITGRALMSFVVVNSPTVQPVLDLRQVGQQVREEIQSAAKPEDPAPVVIVEEREDVEPVESIVMSKPIDQDPGNEELKPKLETERYTALIPTVGKIKKKLGKRNSSEGASNLEGRDIQISEKLEKKKEKQMEIKNKLKEKREEKEMLKLEEKEKRQMQINSQKEKEAKKIIVHPHKKLTKNSTNVPAYEEETSSTTTDSSSSYYDDPEKENNRRSAKICSKLKLSSIKNEAVKPVAEENPNHVEEKHVTFNHNTHHNHTNHKLKHQKSIAKAVKFSEKQIKDQEHSQHKHDHIHHSKHHVHVREIKRKERQAKERKEKFSYHQKSSDKSKQCDRQTRLIENENVEKRRSPTYFNVPLPPVTTSSVWGESRAKFSDVVARNELSFTTSSTTATSSCTTVISSSSTRPLIHGKQITNKPTMYVEPYKQTTTELGPIGSRRSEQRTSEITRRTLQDDNSRFIEGSLCSLTNGVISRSTSDISQRSSLDEVTRGNCNSYFSDDILLDRDSTSNYLDTSVGSNWTHQQNFGNLMESSVQEANASMEDPWNQSLLNTSSYWSSYNPLLLSNTSLLGDGGLLNDTTLLNNTSLLTNTALLSDTGLLSESQMLSDTPLVSESVLLADTSLNGLTTAPSSIASSSQRSSSAGYLWGSSSVWQPWTPAEAPGTPTRRPPGFGIEDPKPDEQPQHQPSQECSPESYNPFSSTNLWNQQQNNPWNFSQGQ